NADRRGEAAQFDAKAALNQIGTMAGQIETRITNMDKYRVADQSTVTFAFNSDVLSEQDMSTLDAVAASVATPQGGDLIELEGFTDNIGTEKYNLGLRDRRLQLLARGGLQTRSPHFQRRPFQTELGPDPLPYRQRIGLDLPLRADPCDRITPIGET